MPIVAPRKPDSVRTWADLCNEAIASKPGETPLDRRVDAYEFSKGVKKKGGTGPYDAGQRPDRN